MDTVAHLSSWTPCDTSTTTSTAPGSPPYQTIEFAKSTHRQFKDFKVHLLVFESAQAIKDFIGKEDTSTVDRPILLNPGELVAAALKGEEEVHSRHIVILGVIAPTSLPPEVQLLVHELSAKSKTTLAAQRYPVWESDGRASNCLAGSRNTLDHLVTRIAQAGDVILREHLYTRDHSPGLLASEGRRLTLGEQHLYAEVSQARSPPKWIRRPDDDILLPCISFEGLDTGKITFTSRTGYHAHADHGSLVIISNRHFPHRRTAGQSHIQLTSSAQVLTEDVVKRHQDRMLQNRDIERSSELPGQKLIAEIRLSMERVETRYTNRQPTPLEDLDQFTRSAARLKEQLLHEQRLGQIGSVAQAPQIIKPKELRRLLLDTKDCLKDTFQTPGNVTNLFFRAMQSTEEQASEELCVNKKVKYCFILCTAFACKAAPLFGKESIEGIQPDMCEAHVDLLANEQAEAATLRVGHQGQQDRNLVDQRQGRAQLAIEQPGDTPSIPVQQGEDHLPTLEDLSLFDEGAPITRKRLFQDDTDDSSTSPIQDADGDMSALTAKRVKTEPGKESIKPLLQLIVEEPLSSNEPKRLQKDLTEQFRHELSYEFPHAKLLSLESIALFRDVNQTDGKTPEDCLLDQRTATIKLYYLRRVRMQESDWDWIVLSLAHKAIVTIESLADKLTEAFERTVDADYIKTFREEDIGPNFYSNYKDEVRGIASFSNLFVDFIGHILNEFIKTLTSAKAKESYDGEITVEMIRNLISVRPFDEAAYIDSLTSNTYARVNPRRARNPIKLGWIRLEGNEGTGLEKTAKRYREAVTEVLFEAYLSPLCSYLSKKDLNGEKYHRSSVRCRKLLKLRLDLIQQLFDNTKLDSRLFVVKTCSDLVFAPKRYLPLTQIAEDRFNNPNSTYKIPPFMETNKFPSTEFDRSKGWQALYLALRGVSDSLLKLVEKRNPGREMIQSRFDNDEQEE